MYKYIILVLITSMLFCGDKPKSKPQPSTPADTTFVLVSKQEILTSIQSKRENLKLQWISSDAALAGQYDAINALAEDSIKVKK